MKADMFWIGIDGFVKASPACRRAVLEAVDALRSAGHECVEVEFPGSASYVLGLD